MRRATQVKQTCREKISISIHALLAESDDNGNAVAVSDLISIHALLAESDGVHYDNYNLHCVISIHALLAESDPRLMCFWPFGPLFLSTLSLRRATGGCVAGNWPRGIFLSTLSLRRATSEAVPCGPHAHISIHALLAESDRPLSLIYPSQCHFYPRSPCGERRPLSLIYPSQCHFYPRSPCGERLWSAQACTPDGNFYPRSPCGERPYSQHVRRPSGYFYPRSPCGERHHVCQFACSGWFISIHALLAESDGRHPEHQHKQKNFYPRSPCGERPMDTASKNRYLRFLSTLSLRRATGPKLGQLLGALISIHALLAESDATLPEVEKTTVLFLSTLSLRRATLRVVRNHNVKSISIHALLAESDKIPD